ncbi:MAG: glycosyltransferase family 92 protein [Chlamydiales bacterium]|nr:glycosyltransferase family 92 protein [Chlamydiales bacterium]
MFKKFSIALFGSLLLSVSMYAEEAADEAAADAKKYNLSVCAIFKNEARYLKEWLEYHLLVGVDHFYLYSNNTVDRSPNILKSYIKKGIVTLVYWPDFLGEVDEENAYKWALSTQIPVYENAIHCTAKNETEWLAILDISEFLVPIQSMKLTDLLEQYSEYPGVTLRSDFFDASRIDIVPKRNLVIETVEMIGKPEMNIQKSVEKTIFKPALVTSFSWAPYKCNFIDEKEAIALNGSDVRINHYANRYMGYLQFTAARNKLYIDNRMLSDSRTRELLQGNYEIEDQERVIHRFIPEMLKRMGFNSTWKWE